MYILTSGKLTCQVKPCAVGFLPFPGNMIPWYLCRTLFASFWGGYHSPNCSDFYQFSTIQQLLHEHMARMHQEGSEQNHVHVHCSGSFLQYSDTVWAVGGLCVFILLELSQHAGVTLQPIGREESRRWPTGVGDCSGRYFCAGFKWQEQRWASCEWHCSPYFLQIPPRSVHYDFTEINFAFYL